MSIEIASLEKSIISLSAESSIEEYAQASNDLGWLIATAKELKEKFDAQLLEAVKVRGKIVIGENEYWAGHDKKTKCRNVAKAVDALLTACGGDFEKLCTVLSSNAIKYGEAKLYLGDKWDDHFEVIVEDALEKKLCKLNPKFLR